MSGSTTTVATAPLTAAEVTDIRRWCGYPPLARTVGPDILGQACSTLTDTEIAVVRSVYATQLPILEMAIPGASGTLNTDKAGPFQRNAREVQEREGLFRQWRLRLCWMLGIGSGPYLDMLIPAAFVV